MAATAKGTESPRPRGRPRKHTTKRSAFNTRIRDELKKRLEAAAAAAGRSLSEEIEFRLERSFDAEEQSRQLRGLMEHNKKLADAAISLIAKYNAQAATLENLAKKAGIIKEFGGELNKMEGGNAKKRRDE